MLASDITDDRRSVMEADADREGRFSRRQALAVLGFERGNHSVGTV